MVRWVRWHCPTDTGLEIQTLKGWGRARYLSVTEALHYTEFKEWMGEKHFCFFQTDETGKRDPNSGVKGSGANHYPKAPAHVPWLLGRSRIKTLCLRIRPKLMSRLMSLYINNRGAIVNIDCYMEQPLFSPHGMTIVFHFQFGNNVNFWQVSVDVDPSLLDSTTSTSRVWMSDKKTQLGMKLVQRWPNCKIHCKKQSVLILFVFSGNKSGRFKLKYPIYYNP